MLRNALILSLLSVLLFSCASTGLVVEVYNPLELQRSEIITLQRSQFSDQLNCDLPIQVKDSPEGTTLPIQLLDLDQDQSWESLLIQVDVDPLETLEVFLINTEEENSTAGSNVFGRFVPERKDDFAWENDRIAFRMYGPALESTGEISSGVDVWVKRVDYPIIDKWYAHGKYHKDIGEGADLYKVGPTVGCGGLGLLYNDSLYVSNNFTDYRVLANGPLRFFFELDYAEWGPEEHKLTETKRISLDLSQHLNFMESHLKWIDQAKNRPCIVAGLLAHPQHSDIPVSLNSSDNYMIMHEGIKGDNGTLGTAIVQSPVVREVLIKKYGDQYLMPLNPGSSDKVAYWAGAGWSKSPWVTDEASWTDNILTHINRTAAPLQITIID